ncbi:MAG: hypothetical protein LWX83_04715 [Anaerolineae bacterium]|nr:hypothetical protein [Anaerolineae bacterium]
MTLLPLLLITDTNIWIDLDHGGLIDDVFKLPYQICASDFAKIEIKSVNTNLLIQKGLVFQSLEGYLVAELYSLSRSNRGLAIADMAAYLLAREQRSTLVTGDSRLVKISIQNGIDVHGLLWLMDEFVRLTIISPTRAVEALTEILNQNARLPQNECDLRIKTWSVK